MREKIPATTVRLMSKAPATEAELGPYKDNITTTFKISGPIEVSITRTRDSTHVPPIEEPCDCHGGGSSLEDLFRMFKESRRS